MTQFETRPPDWLTVEDALGRVLARAKPLETEMVPLAESLGRALAQGALAQATLPPWDNSAMDGYAVRHQDLAGASSPSPILLKVVGEVRAGASSDRTLAKGEAVRIMTGAPLPPGADAIVRVEDTDAEAQAGQVRVYSSPGPGSDIRMGGQDMQAGEEVLPPGTSSRVRTNRPPRGHRHSDGDGAPEAPGRHSLQRGRDRLRR